MSLKVNWDGLGIVTSLACAIHCAILPLVVSSLPFFGINIIHNQLFEWLMIGLAFVVGLYSLVHGYLKHHQSFLPLVIFSAGFFLLVCKQFLHGYENWLLVPAVILIVSAHYINYRFCNRNKCNSPHHTH